MSGQPMLTEMEEDFCYQCHGEPEKQSAMISAGRLAAGAQPVDIEREFKKAYRHPVTDGTGHSPIERLPALQGATPNHAECVDCHNPHQKIEADHPQRYQVAGYSISGQYLESNVQEYEICLKCHADYIGIDHTTRSLSAEFSPTVRSQHPVTRGVTGEYQVSLAAGFGPGRTMKCSDCHTSGDPDGPRGPHGSNHQFLLSGNYTLDAFAEESPYAYEFCYSCHDRSSILSNESFPLHREHILGDPVSGRRGTSCYTCHSSHGSRQYPYLLDFNPRAVSREATTGMIRYQTTGEQSGECYLKCHGHNHGPAKY